MNNAYNIKAGVVSKPKPTLVERFGAGGIPNWNTKDSPKTDETKKQMKLTIAYTLTTAVLGAFGALVVFSNPITGLLAIGIGTITDILSDNAMKSYKLAKIDGLLSSQDVDELMAIVGENKKLQAKLQTYDKNLKVKDLPDDLKKQCYKTIMRQYVAMRNLKIAVEQAKAG
jgi:hypothetical protein